MPNKEQSALLVHRENYNVPKGQEQAVHYKMAKMTESGGFSDKPQIHRSSVKMFETIKRPLELQGYTIEILYHPLGKYSDVRIEDKDAILAQKDAELKALKAQMAEKDESAKDAEIEELKKALSAAKAEKKPETKKEK